MLISRSGARLAQGGSRFLLPARQATRDLTSDIDWRGGKELIHLPARKLWFASHARWAIAFKFLEKQAKFYEVRYSVSRADVLTVAEVWSSLLQALPSHMQPPAMRNSSLKTCA